jgi:hypothetical protein
MAQERNDEVTSDLILDPITIDKIFGTLVGTKTLEKLHEDPLIEIFMNAPKAPNPYGGNELAWRALEAAWGTVRDHLAFHEEASPPNRRSFLDDKEKMERAVQELREKQPSMAEAIIGHYNTHISPLIAGHSFLPQEEQVSDKWTIGLQKNVGD